MSTPVESVPGLTEEMMAHFRKFVQMKEDPYNATPPEVRKKMNDMDLPENKEKKMELVADYERIWTEADANGDGGLNEEEFCTYLKSMYEFSGQYYGWRPECDVEELAKVGYETVTSWTPDETGVTRAAMRPYGLCAYTVRREYEAAGKFIEGYK